MIKDIWHTTDETPESFENIGFYVDGCLYSGYYIPEHNQYGIFGPSKVEKWCYTRELSSYILALEKENEAMREEFEVWHGNYKCEIEEKERLQKVVFFLTGHLRDILQLDEYGHIKLDEITKQQIKTAISDPVGIIMQLEQESNN